MNEENRPISPKKILLAIFVTTMLIIMAVSGIFYVLDASNMITEQVSVNGRTNSQAEQVELYVDGKVLDTYYLPELNYYYGEYGSYGKNYYFYVEVKANVEHVFQVRTSDGEESQQVTEYIKFGDSNYINNLIVEIPDIELTITGTNKIGEVTPIYLFIDDTQMDANYGVANNTLFTLEANMEANTLHIVRITTHPSTYYNSGGYFNETTVYGLDEDTHINLDLSY